MADWFVRPDTSHSGTRDGLSYETAWGGWAAIVWGASGVAAGDTLYVCGIHSHAAQITVGNHGATSGSPTTIRSDYATESGSFVFTAGFLFIGWNHTHIKNLTMSAGTLYCLYLYAAALTGITVQGCTLHGGVGQPMINMSGSNTLSYIDITIDDNDFIGGSGSTLGSAINWVVSTASALNTLTRPTITNNRFTGCASARCVIELWVQDGAHASSKMSDVVISGNTFNDCVGVAIETFGPESRRHTGLRITENTVYNQTKVGISGGAMSLSSFSESLTSGFGANVIARNKAYGLEGPAGFCNAFYGTYRIFDNYAEDLTTGTIDGSAILFDHGSDDSVAYGNRFKRLIGLPGIYYSGNGITVLDCLRVKAYGNLFEDVNCGIHYGNSSPNGQSSEIHNNTFARCTMAVDMRDVADKTSANRLRNNIFTSSDPLNTALRIQLGATGTWAGESINVFHGFGSSDGHTIDATSAEDDPRLDENLRPQAASCKRAGTYLGGKDLNGKHFYDPPNIGAVDEPTATPRYGFKSTQAA